MAYILGFLFLFLSASNAWAIQPHDYPGVYPHQIAHVFLTLSTGIFVYYVYSRKLTENKGWRYIALSAVLFIVWNIYTFLGHFSELYVRADAFRNKDDFFGGVIEINRTALFYYLYKLDNLILAPCLYVFYLGLKHHLRDQRGRE